VSIPTLIDFWRMQRAGRGEKTVVRPCHRKKAQVLTDLLCSRLPTPNLMILEPPRIGKTDLGVKAFESYALSLFPDSEFINTSYAYDLAVANTKTIRDTLTAPWYRDITRSDFGAQVALKGSLASGAQDYFHTVEGGSVKGVGVGGGITGFGAGKLRREFGGAIAIDDPLKAQDKDSAVVKKTCIDWYHGTLESRRNRKLDPMTPILLIMQRLVPNDLAGHLLQTERHRWTVVQIPAYDFETKESIWAERISVAELEHMKIYDPDTYWAQFMQQPSTEGYVILNADYWRFFHSLAEVEKRITFKIITADTAFKEGDANDFSVLQCWGFESFTGAYLLDQIRGKWQFPELVTNAKEFFKKHATPRHGITPATEAWVEDKASGTSLVQTLQREGLKFRQWLPPNAEQKVITASQVLSGPDKVSRAKQCTLPMSMGRIFLPHPNLPGCGWVRPLVAEAQAFTPDDSHLYDDQVDTATMGVLIWMQRGGGVGTPPVWNKNQFSTWAQVNPEVSL